VGKVHLSALWHTSTRVVYGQNNAKTSDALRKNNLPVAIYSPFKVSVTGATQK
jgi:hypothetical protein